MPRLDPRNPMVIDTRELNRRPGTMQELTRRVEAPETIGTDVIAIPAGDPLDLEIRLESVVEGILVSGSVRATATGACVRCLEPATYPVDAAFQELFAYADRAAHHHEVGADANGADEDVVRVLEGDLIDLEPVIRDAVVPSLPFQPVCRDRLPRAVLRLRSAARGGPGPPSRHDRPPVGRPERRVHRDWPNRHEPREEDLTWPSRSGRPRVPTPVRGARTGRRLRSP